MFEINIFKLLFFKVIQILFPILMRLKPKNSKLFSKFTVPLTHSFLILIIQYKPICNHTERQPS